MNSISSRLLEILWSYPFKLFTYLFLKVNNSNIFVYIGRYCITNTVYFNYLGYMKTILSSQLADIIILSLCMLWFFKFLTFEPYPVVFRAILSSDITPSWAKTQASHGEKVPYLLFYNLSQDKFILKNMWPQR